MQGGAGPRGEGGEDGLAGDMVSFNSVNLQVRMYLSLIFNNREFKKLLRRRQRERHKTIGFNGKTKALPERYKFWYISLPYSAKQQREMTKFKVLWRT